MAHHLKECLGGRAYWRGMGSTRLTRHPRWIQSYHRVRCDPQPSWGRRSASRVWQWIGHPLLLNPTSGAASQPRIYCRWQDSGDCKQQHPSMALRTPAVHQDLLGTMAASPYWGIWMMWLKCISKPWTSATVSVRKGVRSWASKGYDKSTGSVRNNRSCFQSLTLNCIMFTCYKKGSLKLWSLTCHPVVGFLFSTQWPRKIETSTLLTHYPPQNVTNLTSYYWHTAQTTKKNVHFRNIYL